MIWAFVDYENVGSLGSLNISEYEKVFVFLGPRNSKLKFGTLPSNAFCSLELIQVATMGPNNLDFHLAFHLGRLHEIADENIAFHIISNDSGFNGLVNHLKNIGRKSKKVLSKATPLTKDTQPELSNCASLVLAKLRQVDGRKRPRKRDKLLNWIKSQCQGTQPLSSPDEVCEELVKAQLVKESGMDITYHLDKCR